MTHTATPLELALPGLRKAVTEILRATRPRSDFDDLVQIGLIGAASAAQDYDGPAEGLAAYLVERGRRHVLHWLCHQDPERRPLRNFARLTSATVNRLRVRLPEEPENREIAAELGISLEEFWARLVVQEASDGYEPEDLSDETWRPEAVIERRRKTNELYDALQALGERERFVLTLRYDIDLTQSQVAKLLACSQARVGQIEAEAVARLGVDLRRRGW